jgi:hypothetical protein
MINKFKNRFLELETQLEGVEATKLTKQGHYGTYEQINQELFLSWCVKAKNLIVNSCGEESQHFKEFEKALKPGIQESNHTLLKRAKSVFLASKEDYEGGYITSIKNLIQAEVFDSELEQASELLSAGYGPSAAVIAGTVLETTLRSLCDSNGIVHGKLDKMNADLTKAGVHNTLVQKRITALAGIRNSAAHGKHDEFTTEDVKNMISEVERIIATALS